MARGRTLALAGAVGFAVLLTVAAYGRWIAPVAPSAPPERPTAQKSAQRPEKKEVEAGERPDAPVEVEAAGVVERPDAPGASGPVVTGAGGAERARTPTRLDKGLDVLLPVTDEKMVAAFRKWTDQELCENLSKSEALVSGDTLETPKAKELARRIHDHQVAETERRGISCPD